MKKYISVIISVVLFLLLWVILERDDWKQTVKETLPTREGFSFADAHDWEMSYSQAKSELPFFYPFSIYTGILNSGASIVAYSQSISALSLEASGRRFETSRVLSLFSDLDGIRSETRKIQKNIDLIPSFLLEEDERKKQREGREFLVKIQKALLEINNLQKAINYWIKTDSRVLILLQNQNEPRSSGGFVGSMVIVDFGEKYIEWEFLDTYTLDRLIPDDKELPAPEFFHPLSKTISLRDANFWPDFEDSAEAYRYFFETLDQKPPETVIALNLNTIKELVAVVGQVSLPEWGLELNEDNFDLGIQFLVESKAAGRMQVKKPVEDFARSLFAPEDLDHFDPMKVLYFDWYNFIKNKNLLAHSQNRDIGKIIRKWNADGSLLFDPSSNNTLYFDFVSVGANKSERFIETNILHDAVVFVDGTVHNALKIERTHTGYPGMIEDLINLDGLAHEVKDLKDEELIWKLGEGESRIVLRVFVPAHTEKIEGKSPSGSVRSYPDAKTKMKVVEIPLNVAMGETVVSEVTYQTKINEGSYNWRPYTLEVKGTPGRNNTFLTSQILTPEGALTGKTKNIGVRRPLLDDSFISLIEY